jgi:hypothetical protein
MLNIFRRGLVSKIMLGVLAIGVFAILITGFGTDGMGGLGGMAGGAGGDALVSVEGEKVTSAEMTDQINRQLARAREQQPELDIGTFLRTGAFEEILRQLVGQKAMLAFAARSPASPPSRIWPDNSTRMPSKPRFSARGSARPSSARTLRQA